MKTLHLPPAARLALLYALFAGLWIVFSDRLLAVFVREPDLLSQLQTVKGWAFVAITAGLLYLAITRDLQARLRAEADLRASAAELRALFAAMRDIILVLDAQGRYLDIAPTNPARLYKPRDELIGRTLYDVFPTPQADIFVSCIRRALETRQTVNVEYSLFLDGAEYWFAAAVSPMLEDSVVWVARDITERKQAEDALRESENRYRLLLEQAADGILTADPQGSYVAVNSRACEMLGYTREELLRLNMRDLLTPEDLAANPLPLNELRTGETLLSERQLRRKDGTLLPVEISARMLEDGRLQAIVRDISSRKHMEDQLAQQLRESRALFRISQMLAGSLDLPTILQQIVDAATTLMAQADRAVIHLLDPAGTMLQAVAVAGRDTRAVTRSLNFQWGEGVAGRVIATGQTISLADAPNDPRYLSMKNEAGRVRSLLVAPVQVGDKRLGTLSVHSPDPGAFSSGDEQLMTSLGVQAALAIENARLFEIERRRAVEAEALQQVTQILISRRQLHDLLQSVVEAIATISSCKYVSAFLLDGERLALQAQHGYSRPARTALRMDQGVVGRVARTRLPVFVPDVHADPDYLALIPGVQSAIGVPLIHAERLRGVLLVESDAGRPLDQNDLNWLMTVGRQISTAVENARLYADLEKALQQEKTARAQLVQSEKLAAMGRLVASVAHELNNPLQAIQNALYLVRQEHGLSQQMQADLEVAMGETHRMADLINRLRETYRPALTEQLQPESLNTVVEDVRKLIATHLRHNAVTFEFDAEPDLPPVPAVRDQLKQAILNLSLNAVEAMPQGGRLIIQTHHQPVSGGVWLTVSDTGTGIDPAALPNVFDPFFTTKESGTGLGLSITHDIIQRHGGRIEVESEPGRGTTFKVWLPVDTTHAPLHN